MNFTFKILAVGSFVSSVWYVVTLLTKKEFCFIKPLMYWYLQK